MMHTVSRATRVAYGWWFERRRLGPLHTGHSAVGWTAAWQVATRPVDTLPVITTTWINVCLFCSWRRSLFSFLSSLYSEFCYSASCFTAGLKTKS